MSEHTEGPWSVHRNGTHGITVVRPFGESHQAIAYPAACNEIKANAHLIAASPDLLAALRMVETNFGYTLPREEREQVRAAIAKATGHVG